MFVIFGICHLGVEVYGRRISLPPPLFIEVPIPSQESEWSCLCVLEYRFSISFFLYSNGFWNYPDSVVLFVFHFVNRAFTFMFLGILLHCRLAYV